MEMHRRLALTLALLAPSVWGEQGPPQQDVMGLALGAPISGEELAEQRGREGIELELRANYNDQAAEVSRNLINSGRTGNNMISDQAFTDAAGNLTVIQNSGNGVAIQSSTQINVSIEF